MRSNVLAAASHRRTAAWLGIMLLAVSLLLQSPARAETASAVVPGEWTARTSGSTLALNAIATGNGQIIVVGKQGTILTSTDGETWQSRSAGTEAHLAAITYGNGLFVATGASGTILTSPDGRTWSPVTSGTTAKLSGISYGAARFVAVGSWGTILTSADGKAWTLVKSETDQSLSAVAFGAGQFVAVGNNGTILTSADGTRWTKRTTKTTDPLSDIAYGGGHFLAVSAKTVLTSAGGLTWTSPPAGEYSAGLWTVTYGRGMFAGASGTGRIVSSQDGNSWAKLDTGSFFGFLNDIAYVGDQFVAVGDSGKIRTSGGTAIRLEGGASPSTTPIGTSPTSTSPSAEASPSSTAKSTQYQPGDCTTAIGVDVPFTITADMKTILLVLNWENGTADFTLTQPDGHVITPSDYPRDTVGYERTEQYKEVFYVIANPMTGTWSYRVTAPAGTTCTIDIGVMAAEPTFTLTSPDTDITGRGPITIQWETDAPAGSTITLFYRTDDQLLGEPIVWQLDAQSGSYTWTPDEVRPGTYTIYGSLSDGEHGPIRADAPGRLRLTDQAPGHVAGTCGRFPDVASDHPACKAIMQLTELKVLSGYTDGTFQPDRSVTRAEFAKMLVVTLGRSPKPGEANPFSDTQGHWAATGGHLQAAVALNAIGGYPDGTFQPNAPVTRAQAIKIAAAALGLEPGGWTYYADIADTWYEGWLGAAHDADLIGWGSETNLWTDEFFRGDRSTTRAEAAMLLANLLAVQK